MNRELTCIICPRGCQLSVSIEDGRIVSISGNACPRGEKYASDECTNPQRTVTTTARCEDGKVVAVKTSATVPKDMVIEVARAISLQRIPNDVRIGDVIICSILGTDADVIVTGKRDE